MDLKIYTLTHKRFQVPDDPMYVPLQVGSAVGEDLGYLRDDRGENISAKNCYYSELTGFYWIWKNDHTSEYVGTCHYRRYLINDQEKVLTKWEYEQLFRKFDVITTRMEQLNNSYYEGFSANHNIKVLDMTGTVIREKYPDYYDAFVRLVGGPRTYYCNMLVTSKLLFDQYAQWLFSIFGEVEKRIDLDTREDAYHKRVFGFISEFLLTVWLQVQKLSVCECKVGMIGEKAETREMKEALEEFVRKKDLSGAKAFFLQQHEKRPDIMMEASDTTGELHLAMQIIATADEQVRRRGSSFLQEESKLRALYPVFSRLNRLVSAYATGAASTVETKALKTALQKHTLWQALGREAIEIAVAIYPNTDIDKGLLIENILE